MVSGTDLPSVSVPMSPLSNGAVASSAMQRTVEPLSSFARGSSLTETLRAMVFPPLDAQDGVISPNSPNAGVNFINPTSALPPRIPGQVPNMNLTAPFPTQIPALPQNVSATSLPVPNSEEMKDISEEDDPSHWQASSGSYGTSANLTSDELKSLIKQNERTADATEEAPTPPELTVELMPHQRRALAWMSKREDPEFHDDDEVYAVDDAECLGGILADDQGLGKTLTLISLFCHKNPKWEDVKGEKRKVEEVECVKMSWKEESKACGKRKSSQSEVEFVKSSRKKGKYEDDPEFSPKSPSRPSTVKEAPIVLDSDCEESKPAKDIETKPRKPWQTLIVCPVVLLNQWKAEIEDKMKPQYRPKIAMYHGPKRERNPVKLAKYDIVLTTYQTLTLEYPKVLKDHPNYESLKKEKKQVPCRKSGPVFRVRWDRVVLDEAQYVKNRSTDSWAVVMSLKARKRWCATGTPIQNTVDDLYSLFRFIRYNRFAVNYRAWNDAWKKKLEHPVPVVREKAFKRFQTVVGIVLLRRTKKDTIDGKPLICLPARNTVKIEAAFQDPEEMRVYHAVRDKSVVQFNKYLLDGSVLQNYRGILLMLLRLRQACSHPFLIQYADMNQSSALSTSRMTNFETPYSVEELKEALELIAGGHPHLDLIEASSRQKVIDMLGPVPRGNPVLDFFNCESCNGCEQWSRGAVLPCGHMFCESCCSSLRKSLRCPSCFATFEDPTVSDVFVCPNDLRREIHAKKILSSGYGAEKICTPTEFRAWVGEEIDVRRKERGSLEGSIERDLNEYQTQDQTIENGKVMNGSDNIEEVGANIKEMKPPESEDKKESPRERLINAFSQPSTKIREILYQLARIRKKPGNEKTLIFSQWTSMLDIVEFHVRVRGYGVCRLDGTMSALARHQQVKKFKKDENNTVFLISLHAGGIGLNLTEACNVILCDVWWNPASEDQAIDRVHRIGQRKDVTVFRFEMKDTVERKIYEICKRKKEASDGALGVTGAQSLGRKKLSFPELVQIFGTAAENTLGEEGDGNVEAAAAARNILRMQENLAAF